MKKTLGVLAAMALCATAQAQTKWDMPTPYSDGEFHTRNVRAFVEDVKKNGGPDITVHSNNSLIKHPDMRMRSWLRPSTPGFFHRPCT